MNDYGYVWAVSILMIIMMWVLVLLDRSSGG